MSSASLLYVLHVGDPICSDRLDVAQGGAITAAFVATFPHLVEKNVVLIASTGLIDVSSHIFMARNDETFTRVLAAPNESKHLRFPRTSIVVVVRSL